MTLWNILIAEVAGRIMPLLPNNIHVLIPGIFIFLIVLKARIQNQDVSRIGFSGGFTLDFRWLPDADPGPWVPCVVAAMAKFTQTTEILCRKRDGMATL